jgi:hypothetical protein
LATQAHVQIATRLFVTQAVMKNPLMTDRDMLIFQQPIQNLFWAPIETYFRFDQHSCFCLDAATTLFSPAHRQTMGLLW